MMSLNGLPPQNEAKQNVAELTTQREAPEIMFELGQKIGTPNSRLYNDYSLRNPKSVYWGK
jgi:hypothetical protein